MRSAAIVFGAEPRALDAHLTRLAAAQGRTRWLNPRPRMPERMDPMQHGDAEVLTWALTTPVKESGRILRVVCADPLSRRPCKDYDQRECGP